jgi:hypothetical protein
VGLDERPGQRGDLGGDRRDRFPRIAGECLECLLDTGELSLVALGKPQLEDVGDAALPAVGEGLAVRRIGDPNEGAAPVGLVDGNLDHPSLTQLGDHLGDQALRQPSANGGLADSTPAKDLFGRYAERMIIENELDAEISGFHLNALSSGLHPNVDLDTTVTVLAANCYRLLARKLPRYEPATPDRVWRRFLTTPGP